MNRADRLADRLDAEGLDLLVVTGLQNLRYLTGYTGSNGVAVVGRDVRRFITDFRYLEQAEAQVTGFDRERGPRELHVALEQGWPDGDLRVGFEDHLLSVRAHARLRELVPGRIELVGAGRLVEELRAVKEPVELGAIAAAAALADEAFETVMGRGLVGRTEREVALDLEVEMRRLGAEAKAFDPIVAAAEHGARPHAEPRDVPIPPRTLVTVDWGAQVDGYCSDCTRTLATGELPDELTAIYDAVLAGQLAGLAAVAPGAVARDVDGASREPIAAAGHGDHFGHGLGHGVGLDVHEAPTLNQVSETVLEPGHVVTVEPGIYVPGVGGARIEDLVAVTDEGHRVLSTLPKEVRTLA